MLEELRQKNDQLVQFYQTQKNEEELRRHQAITTILQNEDCFFQMPIETAYSILGDLGYPDTQIDEIYKGLTNGGKYMEYKNRNESSES